MLTIFLVLVCLDKVPMLDQCGRSGEEANFVIITLKLGSEASENKKKMKSNQDQGMNS